MRTTEDPLEALVAAVRASANHRDVCPQVIRSIGTRELAVRRSPREALKATKNKLHQVGAAYFAERFPYARWLDELREAQGLGPEALRSACLGIMHAHASARERLGILSEFYATTLAGLAPVPSVLDLACGLNPLAIPWMPLAPGAAYYAYDIYESLMAFLGTFLGIIHQPGRAEACDVLRLAEFPKAEVALLLKALPGLEQLDPQATRQLLARLPARHVLVSYPIQSLGGRDKQMLRNYEARFRALLSGQPWSVQRYEFSSELAFLVTKDSVS